MWIKQIEKQNNPTGKIFYQYQLTRSARLDGKVKHISLLYLGSHPLLADKQNRKMLARMLQDRISPDFSQDRKLLLFGSIASIQDDTKQSGMSKNVRLPENI